MGFVVGVGGGGGVVVGVDVGVCINVVATAVVVILHHRCILMPDSLIIITPYIEPHFLPCVPELVILLLILLIILPLLIPPTIPQQVIILLHLDHSVPLSPPILIDILPGCFPLHISSLPLIKHKQTELVLRLVLVRVLVAEGREL